MVPLLLFLFGMVMQCGIRMYTECRDTAAAVQEERELQIVEKFYFWQGAGGIGTNED